MGLMRSVMVMTATLAIAALSEAQQSCRAPDGAPSGTVGGVILDDAGRPVAGGTVVLGDYRVKTDKNGRFTITGVSPGEHEVIAGPPVGSDLAGPVFYGTAAWAHRDKVVVVAGRVTRFEKRLPRGGRIELTIRRHGVAMTEEEIRRLWPEMMRIDLTYPGAGYASLELETRSGRILFWGLPVRSDYQIEFELRGFMNVILPGIAVTPGQTTAAVLDFDPDESTGVAGTVTDKDSHPKGDVRVWATRDGATESRGWAVSDTSGTFRILGMMPGSYRVGIWGSGLGGERAVVEPGQVSVVNLRARD